MSRQVLVVQSDRDKSLGRIGDAMIRAGVELDLRSCVEPLPDPRDYDALVVLPGLSDPVDDVPPVRRARVAIQQALKAELPVLGLCLGGQLLVQALGGDVYPCSPELGFAPVLTTPAAGGDPLLGGSPSRFAVFHAHVFAFAPPPSAETLLTSDVCVQACRLGNAWAFQCHPEATPGWIGELAAGLRGEPSSLLPGTVDFFRRNGVSPDVLEAECERTDAGLRPVVESIATGFAAIVASERDSLLH